MKLPVHGRQGRLVAICVAIILVLAQLLEFDWKVYLVAVPEDVDGGEDSLVGEYEDFLLGQAEGHRRAKAALPSSMSSNSSSNNNSNSSSSEIIILSAGHNSAADRTGPDNHAKKSFGIRSNEPQRTQRPASTPATSAPTIADHSSSNNSNNSSSSNSNTPKILDHERINSATKMLDNQGSPAPSPPPSKAPLEVIPIENTTIATGAHAMEKEAARSSSSSAKPMPGSGAPESTSFEIASTTSSNISDKTEGPLSCITPNHPGLLVECCAGWDVDVDDWWLHRPSWEVSSENETTQCFSPMTDQAQANYYSKLHDIQWKGNCSDVITSTQINSGFSAATNWLGYVFLKAVQENKPFQIASHERKPWLYGTKDNSSFAYCDSEDIACFCLPLSNCPRPFVQQRHLRSTVKNNRREARPASNHRGKREFEWIKEYMMRPTQIMRRKLLEMRLSINLQQPCTTMHVRRGDAGLPRQPFRRYAAVQEYLDAGSVEEGTNILLLTDDQTTIDEIKQFHTPQYNWVYLERFRHRGVDGGWESHVPSGDGPFEVLAIMTETHLAGMCDKLVHGRSGFMKVVRGRMDYLGKKYEAHVVKTGSSAEEARKWHHDGQDRVANFMKEMEDYRRKSHLIRLGNETKQ